MKPEEALDALATPERIGRVREKLSSALLLDNGIARQLSRLDALKERHRRVSAAAGRDAEADALARETEARLLADYRALLIRQREIREMIGRLPEGRQRMVLSLRYLEGMPFFRIAMQMHYDERQIYRYHRAGLRRLAVILALEEAGREAFPGVSGSREKSD